MDITITCKSYEELVQFAETLLRGSGPAASAPGNALAATAAPMTPGVPVTPGAPVVPFTPGVPTAPAAPAAPQMPPSVPVQNAAVPTATASYTLVDIQKAAHVLMDSGRQAELQQLLTGFEVVSLPELPAARYGEFATALRTMGAPI